MRPVLSIIIPTYNKSPLFLPYAIKGIQNQKINRSNFEVIFGNNNGGKEVREFAKKVHAKIVDVNGKGPHIQDQKNAAIKVAKGEYVFILDHDEEMSPTLLESIINTVKKKKTIDAWYLNFTLVEKGRILTQVRNFEESFYSQSAVAAVRIIRRDLFKDKIAFDPELNSGPGDWDIDLQLRDINATFGHLNDFLIHHEEKLGFWGYVTKKTIYADGGEIYKNKWKKRNFRLYKDLVVNQYSPLYRFLLVFVGNGRWRRIIPNIHLYILFISVKVSMACIYFFYLAIGGDKRNRLINSSVTNRTNK
jgi:glycosyltransferase involved in cell wall biosynthesis